MKKVDLKDISPNQLLAIKFLLTYDDMEEYFIDDNNTTTLNVPANCNTIRIAGVGAGGNSSYVNSTTGSRGGGGGAGNLSGYDYPGVSLRGSTIYVSTLSDAVVKQISANGTVSFDARSGTPGPSGGNGGVMTTGPGNNGGAGGVAYARTSRLQWGRSLESWWRR